MIEVIRVCTSNFTERSTSEPNFFISKILFYFSLILSSKGMHVKFEKTLLFF